MELNRVKNLSETKMVKFPSTDMRAWLSSTSLNERRGYPVTMGVKPGVRDDENESDWRTHGGALIYHQEHHTSHDGYQ